MFKKYCIICSLICIALLTMSILGLYLLGMHSRALLSERQQEFSSVARKVQGDVKKKIENFLALEQQRPYTDYQYYYVPMAANDINALVRSPLSDSFSNGLASGYFQLDSSNNIINPYAIDKDQASDMVNSYIQNITSNFLPALAGNSKLNIAQNSNSINNTDSIAFDSEPAINNNIDTPKTNTNFELETAKTPIAGKNAKRFSVEVSNQNQATQTQNISRSNYGNNTYINNQSILNSRSRTSSGKIEDSELLSEQKDSSPQPIQQQTILQQESADSRETWQMYQPDDIVQVRIEPFVPMTIAAENGSENIFAGQVFMIRHVQIENDHFLQGFRLNEDELLKQVTESAEQFLLRGMGCTISNEEDTQAAYTAVLDFGFGELALNLMELTPQWIPNQVSYIRNWFYAIVIIVWMAVIISLTMIWRNLNEQVQLSRKKDDFISAVSHELRTPLTSIRMYAEMLQNDWIKTDDKRQEYYSNIHQESERLTRLVENVLDFSRIQRGKKQYQFQAGNINDCITKTIDMMRPYAEKAGFTIQPELGSLHESSFDSDAVVQIVINLLDNALKYAKDAENKTISVRTKEDKGYIILEVEDRGPGIARNQQKKIFQEFYRCGEEATRQTVGTGLGLALVKKLAEAHNGFVEIINPKPNGALFRVALAKI